MPYHFMGKVVSCLNEMTGALRKLKVMRQESVSDVSHWIQTSLMSILGFAGPSTTKAWTPDNAVTAATSRFPLLHQRIAETALGSLRSARPLDFPAARASSSISNSSPASFSFLSSCNRCVLRKSAN
jgi:hypothetical protein